jgi:hypothetical protein
VRREADTFSNGSCTEWLERFTSDEAAHFKAVFNSMMVDLVVSPNLITQDTCPEPLVYDIKRLEHIRKSLALVVKSIAFTARYNHVSEENRDALVAYFAAETDVNITAHKVCENLMAIGIKEPVPTWFNILDPVACIFSMRVSAYLAFFLYTGRSKAIPIMMPFVPRLEETARSLLAIININKSIFGERYRNRIVEHCTASAVGAKAKA